MGATEISSTSAAEGPVAASSSDSEFCGAAVVEDHRVQPMRFVRSLQSSSLGNLILFPFLGFLLFLLDNTTCLCFLLIVLAPT